MRRLIVLALVLLFFLSISACSSISRQDEVLASVGRYENKQFWTHGGFQDYTDFGVYTFSAVKLNDNEYFSTVAEDDIETIGAFVDNFENWVDAIKRNAPYDELVLNYSFDCSIIDTDDYFYIYEKENYPKYGCYDLWFFDTQTNNLYYFHNNI